MKEYAMVSNEWNGEEIDSTLTQTQRSDAYHEKNIANIQDLFDGKMRELIWADYLFNSAIPEIQKSILNSYDEFVEIYLETEYTQPMVKYMEPIRDYHVKLQQPMPDNIILIEKANEFKDWEQIVEPYKGELLYIDMWVTWCGPCKAEFEFKRRTL